MESLFGGGALRPIHDPCLNCPHSCRRGEEAAHEHQYCHPRLLSLDSWPAAACSTQIPGRLRSLRAVGLRIYLEDISLHEHMLADSVGFMPTMKPSGVTLCRKMTSSMSPRVAAFSPPLPQRKTLAEFTRSIIPRGCWSLPLLRLPPTGLAIAT